MNTLIARENNGQRTETSKRFWPSQEVQAPARRAGLPSDAREWVDPCTLTFWVWDEVEAAGAVPTASGLQRREPATATMLTLLTFAYANNVLDSGEIHDACKSDPAFRFLCGGSPPFPEEITSFRRRHRLELQGLLARVFARLISRGNGAVNLTVCPCLWQEAQERLDIARQLDDGD
ncbi:MAG TPA: transposase [Verrucomicrobiae bacterium]